MTGSSNPQTEVSASPWAHSPDLPASGKEALWRGACGRCPRCNGARLFRGYLKPVAICMACGQDWSLQRADDFPAYIAIFLTGHLITPLVMVMILTWEMPTLPLMAIILPLTAAMMLGFLRPAKGATIALQWWLGMHGFKKERRGGQT